uniref:Tetraspanin n=1 Tax=Kryptolebias marmoratus TaxID=37003 RepID=A0A3Q3AC02_KRYMA
MASICLFWAAGLAIFTLGVWAQISLADYMTLSANRYPNAPLILLATGAAVTAWGFLGCLGVAANLPCLLRAYGFFQLATLVAGLAAGLSGLFYREDIAGGFRSGLQRAVAGYTEDEGRADALDSLQRALECCGAEGWRDWLTSDWGCRNRPLLSDDSEGVAAAGIHPHGCFRKVFSLCRPSARLINPITQIPVFVLFFSACSVVPNLLIKLDLCSDLIHIMVCQTDKRKLSEVNHRLCV